MPGIFEAHYRGVLGTHNDLVVRISGRNASAVGGVLSYLDTTGASTPLEGTRDPAVPSDFYWTVKNLTLNSVDLVTPNGLATVGPSILQPLRFAFALAAHAINPASTNEETVSVSVTQGGAIILAHWLDQHDPQTSSEVDMAGSTFTLYLGG